MTDRHGIADAEDRMLREITTALGLPAAAADHIRWTGDARLPSCLPVTALAAATTAAAALAISELMGTDGRPPPITVDRRLASLWFGFSIRPQGWSMPGAWDDLAGDFRTADGWIKLHTNAPHHRAAALSVLGCGPTRDAVAGSAFGWPSQTLEQATVDAGGCAAGLRSRKAWLAHPQGRAVSDEPLFLSGPATAPRAHSWQPDVERPLRGVRVLDLTRVPAGPVATRFLASYGADVLRIDPPGWDEPGVAPEIMPGKRGARLDLHDRADRDTFEHLVSDADVIVHGYRADALERLGFGAERRQELRHGLIDVSLDAYGHAGPWRHRRGFDSLVQFSCGIADLGMEWRGTGEPVSLPVQALDQATGYLMAAAAVRGLTGRLRGEPGASHRLSLARTAELLFAHAVEPSEAPFAAAADGDLCDEVEATAWGPALRVRPPASVGSVPTRFDIPAGRLGSARAEWSE